MILYINLYIKLKLFKSLKIFKDKIKAKGKGHVMKSSSKDFKRCGSHRVFKNE